MIYSHSRLSTFETCPKQFEFKYVLKTKVEKRDNIEAFMGHKVHQTLEKYFLDYQHTKVNTLHELYAFFAEKWKEDYHDNVAINKNGLSAEHYFELGKKCIKNFYDKNRPEDMGQVIGIEQHFLLDLLGNHEYQIQGYIDLLTKKSDDHYQIHDYKTFSKIPAKSKIENDQQLALYQLWLETEHPNARKIDLIWHYVVFSTEGKSHRTSEQLAELRARIVELIQKIEKTKKFETKVTHLCNYCDYKAICPAFKHPRDLANAQQKLFSPADGVKLADEYARLYAQKKEILAGLESELADLKEQILKFATQNGYEIVVGTDCQLRIKTIERTSVPAKGTNARDELEALIKTHNLWNELSTLDTFELAKRMENGQLQKDLSEKISGYLEKNESTTIYLGKKKD